MFLACFSDLSGLCLSCSLSLPIFPITSFLVEKLVQKKHVTDPVSQIFFPLEVLCIVGKCFICSGEVTS